MGSLTLPVSGVVYVDSRQYRITTKARRHEEMRTRIVQIRCFASRPSPLRGSISGVFIAQIPSSGAWPVESSCAWGA